MATARLGTTLAMATSIPIATALHGVSKPILVCLIMLCIGMVAFFFYATMDKKLDKSVADEALRSGSVDEEESFKVSHVFQILKNRGWWYIAILCVLFYSAVFPFIKYATDLMVNKFHVAEKLAGDIPALLPFGTILLTPLFGNIYDRKGKGATIMIIGAVLLILVHAVYSIPFLTSTPLAIAMIMLLGVALSLVPSAMWPSVPKIIPEKQLGTAYGMIFLIQNIGLSLVPALIGWVLNKYCITGTRLLDGTPVSNYNYTLPMVIFTAFGVLALIFALLLKAEDKRKGYGLELPNIKK